MVFYSADSKSAAEGQPPLDARLAEARAFGLELGENRKLAVRRIEEADLPSVADVLHSAFVAPLRIDDEPLHLGSDLGESCGSWTVPAGNYWAGLYEVFPDCEETVGAQYVLVLASTPELPSPRWSTLPHLTDSDRTPQSAPFPKELELPGDALDDAPLPDLRELFGSASKRRAAPVAEPGEDRAASLASRLFAAIAEVDDDDEEDDEEAHETPSEPADPFVRLIQRLVAEEQLALIDGASTRKLAERLELALERDPMVFQRPGDWFFEQDEVDELFASDEDLTAAIGNALSR